MHDLRKALCMGAVLVCSALLLALPGEARAVEPGATFAVAVKPGVAVVLRRAGVRDVRPAVVRRAARRGRSRARRTTFRVPRTARAGRWRVVGCTGRRPRRCRTLRTLRVDAPRPAQRPAPRPVPPRVVRPPAPPPAPPPPPPPAPPAPDPDARLAIRECGLPAAGIDAPPDGFTGLFAAARAGWSGGDAALSVPLPDGRSLWLFGDSFVGGVGGDLRRDAASRLVRNTVVVQDGGCLETLATGTPAAPGPWLRHPAGDDVRWWWPAGGVADATGAHLFMIRLRAAGTGGGMWDFAVDGTALVDAAAPAFAPGAPRELAARPGVYLGAAIVEAPGATYVYGIDDVTHRPVLARTAPGALAGPYTWWDGSGWSPDPAAAAPLTSAAVGSQISVLPKPGAGGGTDGYVMVEQPPFSTIVRAWDAPAPEGPWTRRGTIATAPAPARGLSYNATLHPQFGTAGGLLLGVSHNGDTLADVQADALLYRPRFLRVTP